MGLGSRPLHLLLTALQHASCGLAGVARTALDWGLAAGLSVSGLYGPLKAWRERQLANIFASGQTLRLQFPKEDLGFVYGQPGAAICPEAAGETSADRVLSRNPSDKGLRLPYGDPNHPGGVELGRHPREYKPSCKPGSRLPHCILQKVNSGRMHASRVMATLIIKMLRASLSSVLVSEPSRAQISWLKFVVIMLFVKACVIHEQHEASLRLAV